MQNELTEKIGLIGLMQSVLISQLKETLTRKTFKGGKVMYYYALSDIHGEKKLLEEAMEIIDIENASKNKIIFLGDYIDNGPESCQVLFMAEKSTIFL